MIYFNNLTKKWCRKCESCNIELSYNQKSHVTESERSHRKCSRCSHIGKVHSLETREKMSDGRKGENHPMYGKHHTENAKKKISKVHLGKNSWMKGKKHTEESKIKNSNNHLGKLRGPQSEETKRKLRIFQLKRIKELGIHPTEDKGSKEYFQWINNFGFDFKPKDFIKDGDVGYRADGYDEEKHIWCEFDTPYHNKLPQRKKDLIRQNNIIKHFEFSGKPLKEFIRVKSDKNGNILETKCVYKGKVN